ncbi:SDR family NAD(P)-dependent oxidoreductase [Hymenobacter terrenus]|uniref:SDR family NAD(P)-dependent oxidoreductase n=1 Tax=Hymenobacter terrenus TaxID=1629124 RepID=UPI000619F150|nr:SDR family NAD(P)-dependent oxidoreductase [Hymenobacter terrenus]
MNSPLCILIGAGPGVGQAVARRFAREGFAVALVARNADKLQLAVVELRGQGATAAVYPVDVADFEALKATLAAIEQTHGPAAVLVYNAAAYSPGSPSAISPEQFLRDFDVSVVGALVAAQQVLPAMRAQGRGTLLFTGGGIADYPDHHATSLSFGKTGIRLLATLLHQELRDTPLKVGTVTIRGGVRPGTHFDPDLIAEAYWELHTGDNQAVERTYD